INSLFLRYLQARVASYLPARSTRRRQYGSTAFGAVVCRRAQGLTGGTPFSRAGMTPCRLGARNLMERRVLVAIFLSFLVLYGYQALFVKPVPKPPPTASSGSTGSPGSTSSAPRAVAPPGAATGAGPTLAVAPPPGVVPVIGATEESDVRVET